MKLPDVIHNLKSTHTAYKGQMLFYQGDAAHHLWVIDSGWVKLFRLSGDGKETIVSLCTAGDTFGETSVLPDHTYPYSVEAVTPLSYGIIPQRKLHGALLQHAPDLCMTMMERLEDKMQQHERLLDQINALTAAQRLACFFIRLCHYEKADGSDTKKKHLTLPLDKQVLAASLSMKPETFSRALKQLQEHGVTSKGEQVTIDDIHVLQHTVCDVCSELGFCPKTLEDKPASPSERSFVC